MRLFVNVRFLRHSAWDPYRSQFCLDTKLAFLCVNTLAMGLKSNLCLLFAITQYYKCTPKRNIRWLIASRLLGNGERNR